MTLYPSFRKEKGLRDSFWRISATRDARKMCGQCRRTCRDEAQQTKSVTTGSPIRPKRQRQLQMMQNLQGVACIGKLVIRDPAAFPMHPEKWALPLWWVECADWARWGNRIRPFPVRLWLAPRSQQSYSYTCISGGEDQLVLLELDKRPKHQKVAEWLIEIIPRPMQYLAARQKAHLCARLSIPCSLDPPNGPKSTSGNISRAIKMAPHMSTHNTRSWDVVWPTKKSLVLKIRHI